MKVVVGMSGGVDSSVAAFLLREAGYEVEGLSLLLYEAGSKDACCSLESIQSAAGAARRIGIPFGIIDIRDDFREMVIGPFVETYGKGLTPNPCILCNRHIKFPALMREAARLGADFIATGHYARVERGRGDFLLKRGVDEKKDQSYVLYALGRDVLGRLLLPLGGRLKAEIREIASRLGFPAASRPESQEICFAGGGDYGDIVGAVSQMGPGPIIDDGGRTVGAHRGIYRYTMGQRKGLGIAAHHPLYVTRIDVTKNALYVGRREAAMQKEFVVGDLSWPGAVRLALPLRASVKVRSAMSAQPALILSETADRVRVVFDYPQWAPAPGQSAVFYEGDTVIGGGVIEARQ
jgi:tRNA-specific 2-thiouridylase